MATTTNYGWTTPDNTDLVKDGAAAIRTLGSAIDTSMNTALGTKKAGLVLLNTTSFSGVASQSISSVFSSTYDNYRIIFRPTSNTVTNNIQLRFRTGSDNTGSNYWYSFQGINQSGTSVNEQGVNQTQIRLGEFNGGNGQYCFYMFDLIAPNIATVTRGFTYSLQMDNSTILGSKTGGFGDNTNTQYTGFSLVPSSVSSFSGTIYTYGYNQ